MPPWELGIGTCLNSSISGYKCECFVFTCQYSICLIDNQRDSIKASIVHLLFEFLVNLLYCFYVSQRLERERCETSTKLSLSIKSMIIEHSEGDRNGLRLS